MTFHTTGVLFKNTFGTEEMRNIVSEHSFIQRFLDVEAALARAEASTGLIPQWAADEITAKADLAYIDLATVEQNVEEIGLFTMAIIEAWEESFDEAGEYIHWGATSQDISDMAMVLLLRDAWNVLLRDLTSIRSILVELAESHRDTPMIGRTHHVHAIPITAGLKAASWLDEVDRQVQRLEDLEEHLFALQFFGATGTLASLSENAEAVQSALADELDLSSASTSWYAARDRFAEFASTLSLIAGTMGRIAGQLLVSNRPEIAEFHESIPDGEIGSSTMPHKRNPVRSQVTLGLSRLVRYRASTMIELMTGLDERDFSTWLMEFSVLPELCLYSARMLANGRAILADIDVNEEAMKENLNLYGALVTSEAVMMRLAEDIGRQTAHDVVSEHAMDAIHNGRDFLTNLQQDERVTQYLSTAELEELTDPVNYTGYSGHFIDRTIEQID